MTFIHIQTDTTLRKITICVFLEAFIFADEKFEKKKEINILFCSVFLEAFMAESFVRD
jgi:hypothetical protein